MKNALIYGAILAFCAFALGFVPGMAPSLSTSQKAIFALAVGLMGAVFRFCLMWFVERRMQKAQSAREDDETTSKND